MFVKVHDARQQPIAGLWQRGQAYYAQLRIPGRKSPVRTRLAAGTVAEARKELATLRRQRESNELSQLTRIPTLADYIARYLDHAAAVGAKRPSSLYRERHSLERWQKHCGHMKLTQISARTISDFILARRKAGLSGRSCDIDVLALNQVLKLAMRDDIIGTLPTRKYQTLAKPPAQRPLWSESEIERLCDAALQHCEHGRQFVDYIRLLQFSGLRKAEAARLRIDDIDWQRKQIGVDARSKGGYARTIDFNGDLVAHLRAMLGRHAPDTVWLFPSPVRGERDVPLENFQATLEKARERAELPDFQFHDLRHHFISRCVMAGIDYMTIAKWVGHKDGGVLIGKVYGHVNNEHRRRMAARLSFTPHVLSAAELPVEYASHL